MVGKKYRFCVHRRSKLSRIYCFVSVSGIYSPQRNLVQVNRINVSTFEKQRRRGSLLAVIEHYISRQHIAFF